MQRTSSQASLRIVRGAPPTPGAPRRVRAAIVAGAAGAVFSGLPSTTFALVSGHDPLAAARAAGTLVPGRRDRPGLLAGAVAHGAVSAFWTAVLVVVNGRRRLGVTGGAVAGLAIAAVDLGVVGRRFPAVGALPRVPQWLDHVAFGAIVGGVLSAAPHPPNSGSISGL